MIRPTVETMWRIRAVLCWVKWLLIIALALTVIVAFLLISVIMTFSGHQPVEGDTYSTPGGNLVLIIVIAGTILASRSSKSRRLKKTEPSDEADIRGFLPSSDQSID